LITYLRKLKQKVAKGMLHELLTEVIWIYQYAKKYWKNIIYYIFMGILGSGMGLMGSIATKYLIDAVTGYDKANIKVIIAIIISMTVGNIIVSAVTGRISTKINLKVSNEIQADIFHKIMDTDWESVSVYHSGDLLNRLNNDVSTVASSVIGWLPSLFVGLLQFTGSLIVILYYDPTMAAITLLSAPIMAVMSRILLRPMQSYNKKMKQIGSEMMSFQEEAFHNIQIIKGFDLGSLFGIRLKKVQKNYMDIAMEYNKFSIITSTFLSLLSICVTYGAYGWGIYRLWSGAISYGTMTMFLQLSGSLSKGFSSLIGMIPSAIGATTSAGRIMSVVLLPREIQEENIAVSLEKDVKSQSVAIDLSHMDFNYKGEETILKDICMNMKPKELIAIIGASGKGKTTLFRILLGLLNPTAGEAKILQFDGGYTKVSASTRKYFSYVPQGNSVLSGTIADNLRMVRPEATEDEMVTALRTACAYEFVGQLPNGLYTNIGEKGCGLSEGQAQRIAIARAILRDAPIMLLDEATSALDSETEHKVLKSIMDYGENHTCIMTTHRKSVLSICDRVYQIDGTRITEFQKEA